MARNKDWFGLSVILAGIALSGALGVEPLQPKNLDSGCCFQVRRASLQEEILAEVDGRGPAPVLKAEFWSRGLHASLTRTLSRDEYQALLQQAEEDGLWQQPSEVPYGGPLVWPVAGRPSKQSPAAPRDEQRLSERFFRYPAVRGLTRQLRQHACLAQDTSYANGDRSTSTRDIGPHW